MEQKSLETSNHNLDSDINNESFSKEITLFYLIKNFYWLWIKPNNFFNQVNAKVTSFAVVICIYFMGITSVADRIDTNILKAYSGGKPNELIMSATTNWINYWGVVLGFGILAAGISWLFWGWIFNLRVKWSGDKDFDPTRGRVIYSVSNLVLNLPYFILLVVPVFFYPDYITYYNHNELWSSLIIIFAIWVHVTKFFVVKGQFNVETWKAVIWFLVIPLSIFFGATIVLTMFLGT
ncbi:MAG: hypothetical protein AB8B80_04580 [Marinicellaceae bacterium]